MGGSVGNPQKLPFSSLPLLDLWFVASADVGHLCLVLVLFMFLFLFLGFIDHCALHVFASCMMLGVFIPKKCEWVV